MFLRQLTIKPDLSEWNGRICGLVPLSLCSADIALKTTITAFKIVVQYLLAVEAGNEK